MSAKTLELKKQIVRAVIAIKAFDGGDDGYAKDKAKLRETFRLMDSNNVLHIETRLAFLDYLYSTNLQNNRYYAIEELAKALFLLNEKERKEGRTLKAAFQNLACAPEVLENFARFGMDGNRNLWTEKYGMDRRGIKILRATSIISKYAYYETDFGFPIYDSIARGMLWALWPYILGLNVTRPTQESLYEIVTFLTKLKTFRNALQDESGQEIGSDTLDKFMWYTGKMMRGTFSASIFPEKVFTKMMQAKADKDIDAVLDYLDKNRDASTEATRMLCHLAKNLRDDGVKIQQ